MLTQCRLYHELTGDGSYQSMEASLRDWLFGCNPWGTSMIIGLPEDGDYPEDTHSAVVRLLKKQPLGGLIDGPVYGSIYNNLKGHRCEKADHDRSAEFTDSADRSLSPAGSTAPATSTVRTPGGWKPDPSYR